jgi:uncharacterized protein (DUF1800 family)
MISLEPWRPTAQEAWDMARAGHLLRRTGFAPSRAELDRAIAEGHEATIDRLFADAPDSPKHAELDRLGAGLALRDDQQIENLRGWWLARMVRTQRPLHARLSLMWHNHFATSNAKVRSAPAMLQQLRTIESLGAGDFRELLVAISRDPAMIVWLDGDRSTKGRPNENYARELFELFSLGVGHYTETDIKEAARAFTGWHQSQGVFRFEQSANDTGSKTVLGVTGPLTGEDVVRIACDQDACARFIAARLLREYLTPAPSEPLVAAFAGLIREERLHIGRSLKRLLASREMMAVEHRGARIKSPVELVIGLARSLEISPPAKSLAQATVSMGQALFEPPSVKGWDGHRNWISAATMTVRMSLAVRTAREIMDARALCGLHRLSTGDEAVRFAAEVMLGGQPPGELSSRLASITGNPDESLRAAAGLLGASPEYQMA